MVLIAGSRDIHKLVHFNFSNNILRIFRGAKGGTTTIQSYDSFVVLEDDLCEMNNVGVDSF